MPVGTSSVAGRGRLGILRRLTDASDSKQQQATAQRETGQEGAKCRCSPECRIALGCVT